MKKNGFRVDFKSTRHSESSPFAKGNMILLPAPFFRWRTFGKYRVIRLGILLGYYEYSVQLRNKIKPSNLSDHH